jgi:hypothetical protein
VYSVGWCDEDAVEVVECMPSLICKMASLDFVRNTMVRFVCVFCISHQVLRIVSFSSGCMFNLYISIYVYLVSYPDQSISLGLMSTGVRLVETGSRSIF